MLSLSDEVVANYISFLEKRGADKLYRKTVGTAIIQSGKIENTDIALLAMSDSFLSLYRRTAEEPYLIISKILRRAAHTINRELLRQNKIKSSSKKFLTICK